MMMMLYVKNSGQGCIVTILLVITICNFFEISASPLPGMDNKLSEEMTKGSSRNKRFLPFFHYYDNGFQNDQHQQTRDYSKNDINTIQMTSDKRGIMSERNEASSNRREEEVAASQVYYITLPSSPYMTYIPDYSYVGNNVPPLSYINRPINSPFINLPIPFISNGKPTGVFTYPQDDYQIIKPNNKVKVKPIKPMKPTGKPDSQMYQLNKGPYTFNGKPSDIYLLRDSMNSIYTDTLNNFYP